jgi:hypothetical protein
VSETSDIPQQLSDAFPGIEEDDSFVKTPEALQALYTQVDRDVLGWRPEPGDKVGGILRDIEDSEEGEFGSYPILIIETPSGRLVGVHAFHTVLRNAIERKYKRGTLRVGDNVAVLYQGQTGEKRGTKDAPHMYRLASSR